MGYGALIGGIISAVGSTAGSLAKSSGSQANAALASAGATLKGGRAIYLDPFTNRNYWNLDVPGAFNQSLQIGETAAPGINQFNQTQLTNMLNQVMPGWQNKFNAMGRNVGAELRGQVPADVQNQIQRFGAQQTIASGIGAGGGAGGESTGNLLTGRTITARDLGLTSLSLTQQGQAGLAQMGTMARNYFMPQPVNPLSLVPFADLVNAQEWMDTSQYDANLAAYNSVVQQAEGASAVFPTTPGYVTAAQGAGSLLQGLGQTNPQTGQSGYSMLGNLFGGGGGGGYDLNTEAGQLAYLGLS